VPARLAEETLLALRGQDYAVRGVMELDHTYSGVSIGKKGGRNSWAAIAIYGCGCGEWNGPGSGNGRFQDRAWRHSRQGVFQSGSSEPA